MIGTKEEFLRTFLPESVREIQFSQINLDITDLSISDILRNINAAYPNNTRRRNQIASGNTVIGILCKTETLEPMQGIFILVGGAKLDINLLSKRYIVIYVNEQDICSDRLIYRAVEMITNSLVKIFKEDIDNLGDFFRKFIYDPYELEEKSDDIVIDGFLE